MRTGRAGFSADARQAAAFASGPLRRASAICPIALVAAPGYLQIARSQTAATPAFFRLLPPSAPCSMSTASPATTSGLKTAADLAYAGSVGRRRGCKTTPSVEMVVRKLRAGMSALHSGMPRPGRMPRLPESMIYFRGEGTRPHRGTSIDPARRCTA